MPQRLSNPPQQAEEQTPIFCYNRPPFTLDGKEQKTESTKVSLESVCSERIKHYDEKIKYWEGELTSYRSRHVELASQWKKATRTWMKVQNAGGHLALDEKLKKLKKQFNKASPGRAEKIRNEIDRLDARSLPMKLKFESARSAVAEAEQKLKFAKSQENNASALTSKYRHWKGVWARIAGGEPISGLLGEFDSDGFELFQTVCFLANDGESDAVKHLTDKAMRLIAPIIELAKTNSTAAMELGKIATWVTREVNNCALNSPGSVNSYAKTCFDWPILMSRKKNLNPDPIDFLESIEQGYKTPMPIYNESNWDKNDDSGQIAWKLWHYVFNQRETIRFLRSDEMLQLSFTRLEHKIADLPKFSEERAWEKWWDCAKDVLEEKYPEPLDNSRLRKLGLPKRPQSNTRPNSGISAKIYNSLREKFKSFAGANAL